MFSLLLCSYRPRNPESLEALNKGNAKFSTFILLLRILQIKTLNMFAYSF